MDHHGTSRLIAGPAGYPLRLSIWEHHEMCLQEAIRMSLTEMRGINTLFCVAVCVSRCSSDSTPLLPGKVALEHKPAHKVCGAL